MKHRTVILAALWVGTTTAAWWIGHRTGSSAARSGIVATREATAIPGPPQAPGQRKSAAADGGTGARTVSPETASLQSILAQVKALMQTGGMQNPSAMLKTITLLGQIRDEDIQAALEEAAGLKEPQSHMMVHMMLLTRWAETDGPAALKYAEENLPAANPMARQMARMGVFSAWAQSDPEAAWAHLQRTRTEDSEEGAFGGRNMALSGLFSSMAAKDPAQAFSRLASLDDPTERQMALNGIAQSAWDDSSRARLMEHIATLPDEGERKEARAAILGQLALMDPDQAVKMTADLPASERQEAAQRVGTTLMMSDPERGATLLLENTQPENKKQIYQQIVAQWVQADANKAGAWLGAQPPSPDLDGARSLFATQVANRDPESAMAWAQTVTDEDQRASTIGQVYKSWNKKDEAAATAALEASGLSPDRLNTIRATTR